MKKSSVLALSYKRLQWLLVGAVSLVTQAHATAGPLSLDWLKSVRTLGTSSSLGRCIAAGRTDSVYVAGRYHVNSPPYFADFDGDERSDDINGDGRPDVELDGAEIVAKYDLNGFCQWIRGMRSPGGVNWMGIAVDNEDGAYVTGYFEQAVDIDLDGIPDMTVATAPAFDPQVLTVKYGSDGHVQWARAIGGPGIDIGWCIASDGQAVYVSGYYSESVDFNGDGLVDAVSAGKDDGFLLKYNRAGDFQWVQTIENPDWDIVRGIAANDLGVFLTGRLGGMAFVAGYTTDGNPLWIRFPGQGAGRGLALHNGIYITGSPEYSLPVSFNDVFAARYDYDGNLTWIRAVPYAQGNGVVAGDYGVFVGGGFQQSVDFDQDSHVDLTSPAGVSAFVALYDQRGGYHGGWSAGGTLSGTWCDVLGIVSGNRNALYVTGRLLGAIDFDGDGTPDMESDTLINERYFLARLSVAAELPPTPTGLPRPGMDANRR